MIRFIFPAAALILLALGSLLIGARSGIGPSDVQAWLAGTAPDDAASIVLGQMRLPRTLTAILAGGTLGLAGALIQGLSRNPLADPGLLGINAGAAFAMVATVWWLGPMAPALLLFPALCGAALAALTVSSIATLSTSPVTLILAGAALTALLSAALRGLILLDPYALEVYRHWAVGAVDRADLATLHTAGLVALAGVVLSLSVARWLDVLALGADMAQSLGAGVVRIRLVGLTAVALLCAAAVMVAGPIAFVGLLAPHLARLTGAGGMLSQMLRAALFGAGLLLIADILGRVIVPGVAIEAGLGVTVIGGPFLIWLVRRQAEGLT